MILGGRGGEMVTVVVECAVLWGRLRGGGREAREGKKPRHRYGLDRIISVTFVTE